ncbi:9075_t:CDS:2 [Acaulospora colombiana]|uniref:9075_t:CDS:1 n=1 Tax=Acaulospora colombiana TaxID=27376 RepID=A0ACA9KFE5_9GLOM|nr:9075_t:CDS:2 [Acaulospora colombiana]
MCSPGDVKLSLLVFIVGKVVRSSRQTIPMTFDGLGQGLMVLFWHNNAAEVRHSTSQVEFLLNQPTTSMDH